MDESQLQHFREKLEKLYAEVNERITSDQAHAQESSEGVGDVGDASVETLFRDSNLSLGHLHTARLREIERALLRIDRGEYGICEVCGGEIELRRLEALPMTRTCAECADREVTFTPPTL